MREELYYGINKIAARLNVGEAKARRWCREGIIISKQETVDGKKKTWWTSETNIVKSIRDVFPVKL